MLQIGVFIPYGLRACVAACVGLLAIGDQTLGQQPELLPSYWFDNVQATDGSTQSSLVFRTVPGVAYTVEFSSNLSDWTELDSIYGLGYEFVTAMRQFSPPPTEPPPGDNPPPEPAGTVQFVSLRMQPADDPAGGTVVSWPSLEGGGAVIVRIPETLVPEWSAVPFFFECYGTYSFFVTLPSTPIPPPLLNPDLGGQDAGMLATLQANFQIMNQLALDNAARSRNAPPPAPPDPDAHRLWRIKADWGLDSDRDGSPDWVEFAAADNPVGVGGLRADAFDWDTDHNAIADGDQLDSDKDGISDRRDPAPTDPAIATSKFTPRWRYAVFQIPADKDPGNEDVGPFMINAQGKVLFPLSVWHQGALTPLSTDNPGEISGCVALAMTDTGQVLGWGMAQRAEPSSGGTSGGAAIQPQVCAWWENPTAQPIIVEADGKFARPVLADFPQEKQMLLEFPFDSLLANDTRFMADHPQSVTNTNTHITNIETWRGVWRRTANDINCEDAPKFSCEDAPKYRTPGDKLTFVGGTDYVWGWKDPGSRLLRDTGNHDFPYPVSRIPTMPAPVGHAGVPVAFGTDGVPDGWVPAPTPEHPDIHAWLRQPKLAGGRDVSDTGLRLVESNNMAQDVRENAFPFWAADLPVELETPRFMNAADNGWFLARRQGGAPDSIVGMPVLFEDDAEATGADSFSLSGTSWFPAGGTQNKSWVMVPMGADPTTLNLRSLATEDSPLALESTLLDFGGGNMSVTVTQPLAPLSLKAKAGAKLPDDTPLASGMEVNLGLTLGAAACVSNPLAGYVMKARTVKVNVYKVVKQTPGKPDNPPDLIVTPEGESDFKTQLETFLNGIFKPQINASFQVNVVTTPLTLNWDVNGDEFLNLNANQDEQSDEQLAILAAIPTPAPASNINVFILGTTMPISGDAWGATTVAPRTCWLVGDAVFNTRTLAKLKADIAHEIGHVLVGPGHPDQGGGHASLPGTDHNRRLMCSGGKQAANPGHLLAKVEWEWSEAWFNKEEDAGRLPN